MNPLTQPDMDKQKINIGLSIELMNNTKEVSLGTFKKFMGNVAEAGKYLGQALKREGMMDEQWENQIYTLKYENCSLDIEMLASANNQSRIIKGFKFQ